MADLAMLRKADEAASVVHDFLYGLNGVTRQQAVIAIWRIHNTLRPLFQDVAADGPPPSRMPGERYEDYRNRDREATS